MTNFWRGTPGATANHLSQGDWKWAPHLRLLDRKIVDVVAGRLKKLLVTMPPRHGKSELCSHRTPVWFLANFPDEPLILSCYGSDFAKEWGRKARNTINEHSAELGVRVSQDSKSSSHWTINGHKGEMYAVGVGGAITGRGGKLLLCDDPIKNEEEARSEVYRDKLWDWWRSTFITRLEPGGGIILIQTRWHEEDLAGRILKHERDEWEVLNLPAIAEQDDPLGRTPGEALWPGRFPVAALEEKRSSMGDLDFERLYQQRPSLQEGNIIHKEWWKDYVTLPEGKPQISVQSYDTAFKEKETNDYTAFQHWAAYPNGFYLLRAWRERLIFPDLIERMVEEFKARPCDYVLVEDKASGQSAIQMLERKTRLPVLPCKAETDKVARLKPAEPKVKTGQCYLPRDDRAAADMVEEIAAFPLGSFDDQVDTFSQAMNFLDQNTGGLNIVFG